MVHISDLQTNNKMERCYKMQTKSYVLKPHSSTNHKQEYKFPLSPFTSLMVVDKNKIVVFAEESSWAIYYLKQRRN
jgi:hypothetical protein